MDEIKINLHFKRGTGRMNDKWMHRFENMKSNNKFDAQTWEIYDILYRLPTFRNKAEDQVDLRITKMKLDLYYICNSR